MALVLARLSQLSHGSVHERRELFPVVLANFTGRDGAVDHDEALLRVSPKRGAVCAIPGVIAASARDRGHAVLQADRDAESKAVTLALRLDARNLVLDCAAQMIAGHPLDRFRAQHPSSVDAPAIEQHLAEAQIVGHGPERAGAGAVELHRL